MGVVDDAVGGSYALRSTGIPSLDAIISGGLPPGSVVCFVAEPASMAEVFVYQFATAGKTYYFAADRSPGQIAHNLSNLGLDIENIHFIDIYSHFNYHQYEVEDVQYPTMKRNINEISYQSAMKSTRMFIDSVDLPEDLFWKFEFWTEEKVIEVLGDLSRKVFAQMMQTDLQSDFRIVKADPHTMRFTIRFDGCTECRGLTGSREGAGYYHAGMFAGILTSLLKTDLGAYETECIAKGDDSCVFIIGPRDDEDIKSHINQFLSSEFKSTSEEALAYLEQSLSGIGAGVAGEFTIIIDTFSFFLELSSDTEYLRKLLNMIYEMTAETGALCYLYLFRDAHSKEIEKIIFNKCDAVIDVELNMGREKVVNVLSILKIRGMPVPTDRVKVNISDRVMIDTSKEIA